MIDRRSFLARLSAGFLAASAALNEAGTAAPTPVDVSVAVPPTPPPVPPAPTPRTNRAPTLSVSIPGETGTMGPYPMRWAQLIRERTRLTGGPNGLIAGIRQESAHVTAYGLGCGDAFLEAFHSDRPADFVLSVSDGGEFRFRGIVTSCDANLNAHDEGSVDLSVQIMGPVAQS